MKRNRVLAFCAIVTCVVACSADERSPDMENVGQVSSAATTLVAVSAFGANPGQIKMYKYVPENMPAGPRPLVVALHGCSQTPIAYESAGWNTLADAWKFYVMYPEQNTARNNSAGCFNWGGRWKSAPQAFVFSPELLDLTEIQRGHGENESIKEMVDKMKADHTIDEKRVFITGLSAGGGMTALMLAVWPDVFSGGAIFAGIPFGCATNQKTTTEAANCLKDYTGANAYLSRTPAAWGELVRAAAPSFHGPYPRVAIWHGTADSIVNPKNQAELVKQWTNVNGIDQTPDTTDSVDGFPHKQYKDANGKTLVETYEITGQSHGTEVAPTKPMDPSQPAVGTCGKAGSYIISAGICSTYYAAKFFGLDIGASTAGDGGTSSSGSSGGSSSGSSGSSTGGAGPGHGNGGTNDQGGGGSSSSGAIGGCTCDTAQTTTTGSDLALGFGMSALVLTLVRRRRRFFSAS